eukprot:COSAG01_NODE_17421_length_1152_cov_9.529915_2_plen_49_part_01
MPFEDLHAFMVVLLFNAAYKGPRSHPSVFGLHGTPLCRSTAGRWCSSAT